MISKGIPSQLYRLIFNTSISESTKGSNFSDSDHFLFSKVSLFFSTDFPKGGRTWCFLRSPTPFLLLPYNVSFVLLSYGHTQGPPFLPSLFTSLALSRLSWTFVSTEPGVKTPLRDSLWPTAQRGWGSRQWEGLGYLWVTVLCVSDA